MLKNFKIKNLFGFRTVDIPFEQNVKILIGENGLGKTTILNCLYYVLDKKYVKLSNVDFESIELIFENNKIIFFTKEDLLNYIEFTSSRNRGRRGIPPSILKSIDIDKLRNDAGSCDEKNRESESLLISKFIEDNNIRQFAPKHVMVSELRKLLPRYDFGNFEAFEKIIDELDFSILYFPTYRRVEEDLKNLGQFRKKIESNPFGGEFDYEEITEDVEISDDTLIHFGMEDVELRFRKIEEEINKSTIIGFSKVTGEMLSQLLKGFPEIEDTAINELDDNTVKLILHRVGNNLPEHDRQNILRLIENKSSLKKKKELVYFIYKLIDIYEEHKHFDDSVKAFIETCNEYLGDKHISYDESSISINVYRDKTDEKVLLSMLSSGEKQIISLFSKIYLEDKHNLIVLFDEPELSLSLEWQKLLLPDIVESNKCKFLLSVTHSPFIFKNELEDFAVGMNSYISEDL